MLNRKNMDNSMKRRKLIQRLHLRRFHYSTNLMHMNVAFRRSINVQHTLTFHMNNKQVQSIFDETFC